VFWNELAWIEAWNIWSRDMSSWASFALLKNFDDRDWALFEHIDPRTASDGLWLGELRCMEGIMERILLNDEGINNVLSHSGVMTLALSEFSTQVLEKDGVFQRWFEYIRRHKDRRGDGTAANLECICKIVESHSAPKVALCRGVEIIPQEQGKSNT